MASLAILPFTTTDLAALAPRGLPVVARIVLLTGILFFVPSVLLGMVSPVVVRLTLVDLGRAGRVVGRIYAWSTLGSIAGTFLTGFALIPWLGTKPVIFGVGLILIALAGGDRRVLPPAGLAAVRGRRGGRPSDRDPGTDPPPRRPRPVVPPGDELLLHPGDHRARGRTATSTGSCRWTG